PDELWLVAAALLSPAASVWAAHHSVGAGLGPAAIKLRAGQVADLPLPRQGFHEAAALVEAAHRRPAQRRQLLLEAARAMGTSEAAISWWWDRLR
ncbi:MAG: hypothetical protein JWL70_238, partial [Acidimicrobiia bacterium]|nr:hypothetical protein [Acidimicrobiia bacterium]